MTSPFLTKGMILWFHINVRMLIDVYITAGKAPQPSLHGHDQATTQVFRIVTNGGNHLRLIPSRKTTRGTRSLLVLVNFINGYKLPYIRD